MYANTQRLQRGLSLVEVFVALLVLSVGLIALAKLQVDLVRGSSDARTRTLALALAEEKIEDLRTFARADGAGTWSVTANPMAWSYLNGPAITAPPTPPDTSCSPACTGGRIPPQTAYGSTLEVDGVRFKRTWEVTDRDFTNAGPPSITSRTKDVRVTVTWENELGVEQQVSLFASLVDIPPGNVALASVPVAERPEGPQITYTPGAAPEIIAVPIDLGTGKRETSKPLPDVEARGYANQVSFDVVNYHTEGSETLVDRREEFVTVNCRCALAGPGRGRTPARVAFSGTALRDLPGKVVTSKSQTGRVLTSGPAGESDQPPLCSVCCRDHHDGPTETVGSTTDYNRYKPTDTTDHRHYLRNPSTGAFTEATATGDAYDEACRLKRINGVFQVFEDWNLQTLTVARSQFLQADPGLSTYVTYVQDYVDALVRGSSAPAKPTGRDFDIAPGAGAQALGRGIYIDRMPDELVTFIAARIADGLPYLEYVPFYEVNLTKLANWSLNTTAGASSPNAAPCPPGDDSAMILCVTNEAIVDEGLSEINYSRGWTVAGHAPAGGSLRVVETARGSNTGLTGTPPISTVDDSVTRSDYVTVAVDAGATVGGVQGNVSFCSISGRGAAARKDALFDALRVNFTGGGGGSCTKDRTGTSMKYSCAGIPTGSTITIVPSFSPTGSMTATPSSGTFTIGTTLDPGGPGFVICDY